MKRGSYRKGALTEINSSGIIFGVSPGALTGDLLFAEYFGNQFTGGVGGGCGPKVEDEDSPGLEGFGFMHRFMVT